MRHPEIDGFLSAVRRGFDLSDTDTETRRCVDEILAALAASTGQRREGGRRVDACRHLDAAALLVAGGRPEHVAIMEAFLVLEPRVNWSRRNGGPNASDNIMQGHANAMVVGPGGLEAREDVYIGVSLLAPHVRYPDHHHTPEEVYLCLTDGEFMHGEGTDWFTPGPGGSFYNPPDILHAMRSGNEPLFAIWCLRRVG